MELTKKQKIIILLLVSSLLPGCGQNLSQDDALKLKTIGINYAKNGRCIEAIRSLEKASKILTKDLEIYRELCDCYEKTGSLNEAENSLQKILFLADPMGQEAKEAKEKLKIIKDRKRKNK